MLAHSALENDEYVLQLHTELMDDLPALTDVVLGFFAGKPLASATDREPVFVEKASNLANEHHVLPLIVASISPTLQRRELWKLLLPVTQNVRLHATEVADLTDGEVALSRYRRKFAMCRRLQHMLPHGLSASDRGGT